MGCLSVWHSRADTVTDVSEPFLPLPPSSRPPEGLLTKRITGLLPFLDPLTTSLSLSLSLCPFKPAAITRLLHHAISLIYSCCSRGTTASPSGCVLRWLSKLTFDDFEKFQRESTFRSTRVTLPVDSISMASAKRDFVVCFNVIAHILDISPCAICWNVAFERRKRKTRDSGVRARGSFSWTFRFRGSFWEIYSNIIYWIILRIINYV